MTRNYVWHSNGDAEEFIKDYFPSKNILYVGSIGFDPRTLMTFKQLNAIATHITPVFIQEERKGGSRKLKQRAKDTESKLKDFLGQPPNIISVQIFADDGAPIGGVELIKAIRTNVKNHAEYTDIVIDICAMSRGIFFPLVKYFRNVIKEEMLNSSLHVLVVDHPLVDYSYIPQYHDRAGWMKSFAGDAGLKGKQSSIKLWLPQLMSGRTGMYDALFSFVKPDDVCPMLPFPGIRPKMVDELMIEYRSLISGWDTSLQNVVLTSESDPLDMYDTVRRAHDARKKIFDDPFTILSPMGTKVSTIGGLLAAMDMNLPVAYVETLGYYEKDSSSVASNEERLVHVWVDGPIYQSENDDKRTII